MEYRVIKSKFGNDLLYVTSEKMLYKWSGRRDEFDCYQKVLTDSKKDDHLLHPKCGSRIRRLPNGLCERMNVNIPHTAHEDHESIALDKEMMNNMVETCANLNISIGEDAHRIPTKHIFQRELIRAGPRKTNLNHKRVKRTLLRKKNPQYPKIPKSIEEFKKEILKPEVMSKFGYSYDGDSRFYVDTVVSPDYDFIIFCSQYVIDFITEKIPPEERYYMMDGTFNSIPREYYQLLMISVEYRNDVFPLVYCLSTRKTTESYVAIFQFIENNLLKLEPKEFMTDYEDGMRLAIRKCFPNVRIRGCWWHHKRAVHRKCVSFGMSKLLRKNRNARQVKDMLTNLPLLPENQIYEGYRSVKEFARKKELLNQFHKVFSYYEDYWFKQNERNAISVTDLNMRTTSSLEAMNSVIQRTFPSKTNIYKFITNLKMYESIKSSEMYQLFMEGVTSQQLEKRRVEDRLRQEKIKTHTKMMKDGTISVADFLISIFKKGKTNLRKPRANRKSRNVLNKVRNNSKTIIKKPRKQYE